MVARRSRPVDDTVALLHVRGRDAQLLRSRRLHNHCELETITITTKIDAGVQLLASGAEPAPGCNERPPNSGHHELCATANASPISGVEASRK